MRLKLNKVGLTGDTMIEVVVITFIMVVSLVALTSVTVASIARNRLAKERVVAVRLAQEGLEYIKSERDRLGFDVIDQLVLEDDEDGTTYCLSMLPKAIMTDGEETSKGIDGLSSGECTEGVMVQDMPMFMRFMMLSRKDDAIQIKMTVKWAQDKGVTLTGSVASWSR